MNFERVRQFMDHLTRTKVPGNAICIYLGGQKVFEYASGYADLETQTPMTGRELVNIYSCSKVTTVTAAAQLLERGAFLLTDPLSDYFPEYRRMKVQNAAGEVVDAQRPITVGDLFAMTAGLNYDLNAPAIAAAREKTAGRMDTVTVARCLAQTVLSFEPGASWQYSLCHDVLAGLVALIADMPFRDYVQKNVFDPLEMRDTVYHHTPEVEARMASQYCFVPDKADADRMDFVQAQSAGRACSGTFKKVEKSVGYVLGPDYDSGGAGITTAVGEYVKLVAALANNGLGLTGARILSANTVRLMHTNRLNAAQMTNFSWRQLTGYGYGLGVRTLIDPAAAGALSDVGEFGWGGAAGATVLADAGRNLAVFYAHHMLNPQEEYYQPRLRNVVYSSLDA